MTKLSLRTWLIDRPSASPESLIVRCLSERGALSASQITRLTGLARSTVSSALNGLRKSGMVIEASTSRDGVRTIGRPAAAVTLNPTAGTCVGIHLGLQQIRIVVADVSHSVIAEQTIPMALDYQPQQPSLTRKTVCGRRGSWGLGSPSQALSAATEWCCERAWFQHGPASTYEMCSDPSWNSRSSPTTRATARPSRN